MIKKGDILTKKPSYQLLNARFYHTSDVLDAMQEYAEEYHRAELLKLNKSDVISSVCICECGKQASCPICIDCFKKGLEREQTDL